MGIEPAFMYGSKMLLGELEKAGTKPGDMIAIGRREEDRQGGNLKAVQALLGHASISTTADTYTDWDVRQLEASLLETFATEDEDQGR